MTQTEFVAWREFHRMFPLDDFHRLYRPAAMIAQSMAGGDLQPRLDWLAPEPMADDESGWSAADKATFKAFGAKPPKKG